MKVCADVFKRKKVVPASLPKQACRPKKVLREIMRNGAGELLLVGEDTTTGTLHVDLVRITPAICPVQVALVA